MKAIKTTKTITERAFVLTEDEAFAIRLLLGALPPTTVEEELKGARPHQASITGERVCQTPNSVYCDQLAEIYDYLCEEFKP